MKRNYHKRRYKNNQYRKHRGHFIKDAIALLFCCIAVGAVYLGWNEKGFSVRTLASNTQYIQQEVAELLQDSSLTEYIKQYLPDLKKETEASVSLTDIPAYSQTPYVEINGNLPNFIVEDLKREPYEYYSELDPLGRCGYAEAMLDKSLMPNEERGKIGMVKPSGWHTVKYDCVDGKYLYNRCHLLAYMLTGENANEKNLITGTRYMNVEGMLPFESMIADYIEETGGRVLYRVTPIYDGKNLLASGVLMEAQSVKSKDICFSVYVYNVQPAVSIDYANGNSWQDRD